MRVALVHECLVGYHGSERVLAELAGMFPEAPIFLFVLDPEAVRDTPLAGADFRPSFLDHLPGSRTRHRWLLPLMPMAAERFDLRAFDLVISSHHTAAHGVLTRGDQRHLVYTHSPARYAWDLLHEHLPPHRRMPVRRQLLHRFRLWDTAAGRRPDAFLANSSTVARRVRRVYGRDAEVVHPPVAIDRFDATRPRGDTWVLLGRLVAYKRTADAARALADSGRPVHVIGDGPARTSIAALADAGRVTWSPEADDTAVAHALATARGLVFAGEEDFGIGLVEAQAAGCPVVAWDRGGARDIVREGETGILFGGERVCPGPVDLRRAIVRAVDRTETLRFDPLVCRRNAERFEASRFRAAVHAAIESLDAS